MSQQLYKDLLSFEKVIEKRFPPLCLIISKEQVEVKAILKKWQGEKVFLDGDNFSRATFLEAVESNLLFSKPLLCSIGQADKLKEKEALFLASYLPQFEKTATHNAILLFSSTPLKFFSGKMVLQLEEEKPWVRRKRVEEALKIHCKECGITISSKNLQWLIDALGTDIELLIQEIEKTLCYCLPRKEIELQDMQAVIVPQSQATLWDLGEAIFLKNSALALQKGKGLLESGLSFFTLLAHLRTQYRNLLNMSILFKDEGVLGLQKGYPYLRGAILDKKIAEIRKNSLEGLTRGLYLIFQKEIEAKNSTLEADQLLETLLALILYDSLSAT